MDSSSTSSSEAQSAPDARHPLRFVAAFIVRSAPTLMLIGVFCLLLGELWMHRPGAVDRLRFVPDEELGSRLAENQRGYIVLAAGARLSKPIGFDERGARSTPEPSPTPTSVVAVGASESLGAGVSDAEVWTARLATALPTHRIDNFSQPGTGLSQHRILLRRAVEKTQPALAVVRVSLQTRNFGPKSADQIAAAMAAAEGSFLKSLGRFLPFALTRAKAQLDSLLDSAFLGLGPHPKAAAPNRVWDAADAEALLAFGREALAGIIQDMAKTSTPLLFVHFSPYGGEGARILDEHLRQLASAHEAVHLLTLGPATFQLEQLPTPEARRQAYAEHLTLGWDPHANAEQHQLFAQGVLPTLQRLLEE